MVTRNILVGTLILAVAAVLICCDREQEAPGEFLRPVRVEEVFVWGGARARAFSGVAQAATVADLSFRVGGVLQEVSVKVGGRVKAGERIAAIDDSEATLNFEKARAEERNARVQLETAKSNLDRVRDLFENMTVSLSEYEKAKNDYAAANAAFETSRKNAALRERELGYYRLHAPMEGIITSVSARKNENVKAGQVVAVISSGDDMEVQAGLPESYIARVKAGEKVKVTFPALAGKMFDGVVDEVSYSASAQSSTYPVTVLLTHPTNDIRPGMAADVAFQFEGEGDRETLMVPVKAVAKDSEGTCVYVAVPGEAGLGHVERRSVRLGRLTDQGFEVLGGVEEGERVVTAGLAGMRDGLPVRLGETR